MTTPQLLTELHRLCRDLATEAAQLAHERRSQGVEVAATKSSDVDVVTAADREVEQWLRERIASARPRDAILGEEDGVTSGDSGLTWVIDPIDGTVNYLYGLPHHAVSVAVCAGDPDPLRWQLLAGAVTAPVLGHTWHAVQGGGAWRDEVRLTIPDGRPLSQALVATGFSYLAPARAVQGRVLAGLLPRVRDVRRLGSASVDLCMVAEGAVDAYFERGIHPWDMAAGMLVVLEAGGRVRGLGGRGPSPDMVIAGAADMSAELARLLEELSD